MFGCRILSLQAFWEMTTIVKGTTTLQDVYELFQMPIELNTATNLPKDVDFHGKFEICAAIQSQPGMIEIGTFWNG